MANKNISGSNNNMGIAKTYTNISLALSIISALCSICCCVIGGIPLGIFFGIFGIAFAIIGKNGSSFSGTQIFAVILSSFGIIVGCILFFVLLNAYSSLSNPEFANEYINQLREIFNSLPDDLKSAIPADFKKLYGL